MNKKIIAIVLARGGSKGIPKKNILDFCGKPLVAWSIIQAKTTKEIDEVYISSDSDEILKIGTEYGAKTIKRPDSISGDLATSEEAILHALTVLEEDYSCIIMLEAASPLRRSTDLSDAIRIFKDSNYDSAFSSAELQDFLIWKKEKEGLISINYDYKKRGTRQLRKKEFLENGAIYLFKPELILKESNRIGGKIGLIPNAFWQSFEIDEKEDWKLVELIFKNYLLDEYNALIRDENNNK